MLLAGSPGIVTPLSQGSHQRALAGSAESHDFE